MRHYRSLSVIALLFVGSAAIQAAEGTTPPNLILIISDDQMWTDFGFMGHPTVKTPHIDRLAAEGLTFKRGYVPSSLCCPSLATIITGRYPHEHKVTSNDPPIIKGKPRSEWFEEGRKVMNKFMEDVPTLPRLLSQNGYLTLQTGKWWQGHYSHGGFTHGMTKGGRHGDDGLTIGRETMEPITEFISTAKQEKKPFMVWYAPFMPHTPHTPPKRLFEKYKGKDPSDHVARYYAMIDWFDETIGELRSILDKQGVADNTVIAFVVDNGWIQEKKNKSYAAKSKQSQYDGGLRTPIIIHWPNHIAAQMPDDLAHSIDLFPTLMKIAGVPVPKDLPGIDLLDSKARSERKTIYGEVFTHNAVDLNQPARSLRWRWLIDGNAKLIVPDPTNEPKAVVELYDLAADPLEENDLATKEAQRVTELRAKLDAWWNPAAP